MDNRFRKSERISGRKTFDQLFGNGREFFSFPFRVVWLPAPEKTEFPAQVAFGVSKRNFKKAVDRNRVKRLLRDSYRRSKGSFYESLTERNRQLRVLIIYTQKSLPSQGETDAKIILTLRRLIKETDAAGKHKPQA